MAHAPALKTALKRGALIAAANWPLVVVQFVAESTLKLILGVPVVGGIFLVVLLLDANVEELLRGDVSSTVTEVALKYGFGHPGRFSRYYQAMFGEAPAVTLRRSRHLLRGASMRRRRGTAPTVV